MRNTILYLIGHFGAGKYTIAKEICALTDARLVDNHLFNNVVFSLLRVDGKTPIPEAAWDHIMVIRQEALTVIETLAPPEFSFVLTNMLRNDDHDRSAYEEVARVADKRGATFVPVVVTCSDDAFAKRIGNADRIARMKFTDAAGAEAYRTYTDLLQFTHPNRFDLDTTDISAAGAAQEIIAYAKGLN